VKQILIVFCLASAILVIIAGCQAGGTNSPEALANANANANTATKPETSSAAKPGAEEARALLTAHDKALNDKNIDALLATFSSKPDTVVLGTGTEERWVGPESIKAAYTEMFKDYDAGTLNANCDWKTGGIDSDGSMAWVAASCTCKDSLKGKAREYKLNVSATAEKQDGKWKFVVLHMSNAFTPPVTQ
jgi:ketosteroid isomerase-like protein